MNIMIKNVYNDYNLKWTHDNNNNNNNNNKGNKWHVSFESKPFYQLIRINWNVYNIELVKQIS